MSTVEVVALGEPAPDKFVHVAERMANEPKRCVVVEDSRSGVEAARAAGMRVMAFAGGLTPARLLEGPGTILFEDMRELPRLLEQRSGARPYRDRSRTQQPHGSRDG